MQGFFNEVNEKYTIDSKEYAVTVDPANDSVHIYGPDFKFEGPLHEYMRFSGKMRDYVEYLIGRNGEF